MENNHKNNEYRFDISSNLFNSTGAILYKNKVLFTMELDDNVDNFEISLLKNFREWYSKNFNPLAKNLNVLTDLYEYARVRIFHDNELKKLDNNKPIENLESKLNLKNEANNLSTKNLLDLVNKDVNTVKQELEKEKEDELSRINNIGLNSNNNRYFFDKQINSDSLDVTYKPLEKIENNIKAIKLIKEKNLGFSVVNPTTNEEKSILAGFTGWGGVQQAFYESIEERDILDTEQGKKKEEIVALLTDAEYKVARSSVLESFYTPAIVTQEIWNKIREMGFSGGKILEPSCGTGAFMQNMPNDLYNASLIDAIELDNICAIIAKNLNPKCNVFNGSFKDFEQKDYDLVISNPPYGNSKIDGLLIHDYFVRKSIDSLKEGGIYIGVVTSSLLDSKNSSVKDYMLNNTNMIGAIRLPNTAFKDSAKTGVITDIIFLRKKMNQDLILHDESRNFLHLAKVENVETLINEYYKNNPQNIIGNWVDTTSQFGIKGDVEYTGNNIQQSLREAFKNIDTKFLGIQHFDYLDTTIVNENGSLQSRNDLYSKDFDIEVGETAVVDDYIIMRVVDRKLYSDESHKKQYTKLDINIKATTLDNYRKLTTLAKTLNELQQMQLREEDNTSSEMDEKRKELNTIYDKYVAKYGYLNKKSNKDLFENDRRISSLLTLEDKYKNEIINVNGRNTKVESAEKSNIFTTRTQFCQVTPTTAENIEDAVNISLSYKGSIDLNFMTELLKNHAEIGGKIQDVIEQATSKKLIYLKDDKYISRKSFLTGDIKTKYENETNTEYKNDLKEFFPNDIFYHDIAYEMGANWIPTNIYNKFLAEKTKDYDASVVYSKALVGFRTSFKTRESSLSTSYFSANKIINACFSMNELKAFDKYTTDGRDTRILNEEETMKANNLVVQIKNDFVAFIESSQEYRDKIESVYNNNFNRKSTFSNKDNSIKLPLLGKVDNSIIELRPHQKNAVTRLVETGKIYLDHTVGTGKTFTIIAGIMEMKRLNLINKALIVTPKTVVADFGKDFMKLYPQANILVTSEDDFKKEKRKTLISKMTNNNYDAIIISHSQLQKIKNPIELEERIKNEAINDIENELLHLNDDDTLDIQTRKRTIKQLETLKRTKSEKFEKLKSSTEQDDIFLDKLGIDFMAVDEAHLFKNLFFSTSLQGVRGLGSAKGSGRAYDMYLKTQYFQDTFGKNVAFLSGTPISNSLIEMYTVERYMNNKGLKDTGLTTLDLWLKQFGVVEKRWEVSASGEYKLNSRLSKFKNLPELIGSYSDYADIVTRKQMINDIEEQGKTIDIPSLKSNKPTLIVNQKSEVQKNYIGIEDDDGNCPQGTIIYRSKNIKYPVKKGGDNSLVITGDAKKLSIDMRLINPQLEDDEDSKINNLVDKVFNKHQEFELLKGTQIIFSDIGTPKKAREKELAEYNMLCQILDDVNSSESEIEKAQKEFDKIDIHSLTSKFDVYADIKEKLVKLGVKENEVAFIHDYDTQVKQVALFNDINDGKVRIVLGSTSKMGAGVNIQSRLVGLHHLDVPWRPSDLEQREGRIIRQGNNLNSLFKLYANIENKPNDFAKKLLELKIDINDFLKFTDRQNEQNNDEKFDFEIEIFRYVTKGTLDTNLWDIIVAKANFIEQIKLSNSLTREISDDSDLESKNAEEIVALCSDNPLLLEALTLKTKLKELELDKKVFLSSRKNYEIKYEKNNSFINDYEINLQNVKAEKIASANYRTLLEIDEKTFFNKEENKNKNYNHVFQFNIVKNDNTNRYINNKIKEYEIELATFPNNTHLKSLLDLYKKFSNDDYIIQTRSDFAKYCDISFNANKSNLYDKIKIGRFADIELEISNKNLVPKSSRVSNLCIDNFFIPDKAVFTFKIKDCEDYELTQIRNQVDSMGTANATIKVLDSFRTTYDILQSDYARILDDNRNIKEQLGKTYDNDDLLTSIKIDIKNIETEIISAKNKKKENPSSDVVNENIKNNEVQLNNKDGINKNFVSFDNISADVKEESFEENGIKYTYTKAKLGFR